MSRYMADESGGTCRNVIDLSVPHRDHPHQPGRIAVAHSDAPPNTRPRSGRLAIQFVTVLPDDLHCGHCAPSEVTAYAGVPSCVSGALMVTHQPTCPRLRALVARFGVEL